MAIAWRDSVHGALLQAPHDEPSEGDRPTVLLMGFEPARAMGLVRILSPLVRVRLATRLRDAVGMARELQPKNIHVAQIVIDGGIYEPTHDPERLKSRGPDGWLDPDSIAQTYLHLHRQHRSTWGSYIELRPWAEKF